MSEIDPGMIQLVKEAMRLEVRGRGFFLHAAEVTENELGRKMFRRLFAELAPVVFVQSIREADDTSYRRA